MWEAIDLPTLGIFAYSTNQFAQICSISHLYAFLVQRSVGQHSTQTDKQSQQMYSAVNLKN